MPYVDHSCRLKDPDLFEKGSFRTIERGEGKNKLSIIIGRPKGEKTTTAQAYRYDKAIWTEARAKAHCAENDGTFEPAEEEMAELKTETIKDVELLAVGRWQGVPKTFSIDKEGIAEIIRAFEELRGNPEYNYDPPVKLGHAEHQKLLQADGYPSAGWVRNLRQSNSKLIGDFEQVPAKIADIIRAGGWKYPSVELLFKYKADDKVYPLVLGAVSILGEDIPAVKSITDILHQYASNGVDCVIINCNEPMVTLDGLLDDLETLAEREELVIKGKKGAPAIRAFLREVKTKLKSMIKEVETMAEKEEFAEWTTKYVNDLPDSAFAYIKPDGEKDEEGKTVPRALRYLPYKDAAGKVDLPHLRNALARLPQTKLSPEEKRKVLAVLRKAAEEAGVGEYAEELQATIKEVEIEMANEQFIETLRAELDLSSDGDVLEAIKQLKAKHQAFLAKEQETHAEELVNKLITEGRLTPAQKDWAMSYARADEPGFIKFSEAAPQVVKLGELGSSEGAGASGLTPLEQDIAKRLGITPEVIAKYKEEVR